MFANTKAFSGFAVPDLQKARAFYEGTLGLRVSEENALLTLHLAGGRTRWSTPSGPHAGDVHHSQLPVPDIDAAVGELATRGVQFERYDGFGQDERGISRLEEGPPIAWFKDPAGNILAVLEAS